MKNINRLILIIISFLLFSCDYFEVLKWDLPKLPGVIIYDPKPNQIQDTSAVLMGEVITNGGIEVTQKGICYSTSANPKINDEKIVCGSGIGSFTAELNGLTPGSIYYCKAYATNKMGTAYSEEKTFTTKSLPVITTKPITSITSNSALTGAIIKNEGSSRITQKGICYGTSPNPIITNFTIVNFTTASDFNVNISGLKSNTTYYVRAFATNGSGTAYGNEVSFKTLGSLPTLTTLNVTFVTSNSSKTGGNIIEDGGSSIISRGICYSTSLNPTISNNIVQSGSGIGNFNVDLLNLLPNTTYFVRSYATNNIGTGYGNEISFKTVAGLPTLTTISITSITANSAKTGGNITNEGGAAITARGVCYSTTTNPTTSGSFVQSGSGTGSFSTSLSNLVANTTYYVRAYAKNSAGTAYGNEVSFKTDGNLPTLTTISATSITSSSARSGGNISTDGGSSISNRGICYSTLPNPTTSNSIIQSGTGTGSFTVNLTNLLANTTYYIRSYAVNSTGTAYGNEVSFKTNAGLPTITTTSITSITINSAKTGGDITADGGAIVTARGVCYSTSSNPTTSNSFVQSGSGTGSFSINLINLTTNTTYYVRAFAINSSGTAYGNEVSFKTTGNLPILTTTVATTITGNSAKSGGNITTDGGSSVTGRGICYNTSPNPTTSNYIVQSGSGTGSFNVNLTNLATNTTYYVRAYAINGAGTAYGNEVSFKTLGSLPILTTGNVSSVTGNTAISGGNISVDGGSSIITRGICFSTTPNPTTSNSIVESGSGTGSFYVNLINLVANTTYYIRAFATNASGTAYGNEVNFKTNPPSIGDTYQGGIVFYLDKTGAHGLIAAQTNQSSSVAWGCAGTNITNCDGTAIGTGLLNTSSIVGQCSTTSIAAKLCYNLTLNGYDDWYLPSLDELKAMYSNLKLNNLGNFDNENYWSSTQFLDSHSYYVSFSDGSQSALGKSSKISVRAIRSF